MINRKRWRKLTRNEYRYIDKKGKVKIGKKGNKKHWEKRKQQITFNRQLNLWIYITNVRIIVSIGDYKNVHFDILTEMVITKEIYDSKTDEQWINFMCEEAQRELRKHKHYGLAEMIRKNTYTRGIDIDYTKEPLSPFKFIRFIVRDKDRLAEVLRDRPTEYKKEDKEQKVL